MATQEQIQSFQQFASEQVSNGGADLSIDALYSLWRAKNPSPEELLDSVAAVNTAISELESGNTGIMARHSLRQTCHRLGLVVDE